MRMRQLNFTVKDTIYNDLARVAQQHGMRRSELCRAVLASVANGHAQLGVVRVSEVIKNDSEANRIPE